MLDIDQLTETMYINYTEATILTVTRECYRVRDSDTINKLYDMCNFKHTVNSAFIKISDQLFIPYHQIKEIRFTKEDS